MSENATPGDVIQIDPEHDEVFGGCFAVVKEVKGWGVSLCYVSIPSKAGDRCDAFYRIPHGKYVVIGRAEWVHADREEMDDV